MYIPENYGSYKDINSVKDIYLHFWKIEITSFNDGNFYLKTLQFIFYKYHVNRLQYSSTQVSLHQFILVYVFWDYALKISNYRSLNVLMVWQVIIKRYLLPSKDASELGPFWMSFLFTFKKAENHSYKKAHWIFHRNKSIDNDMMKCQAISFHTLLLLQWTSFYCIYSVTLENYPLSQLGSYV